MNEGVVSVRYARALLKLTAADGRGEQVCAQILHMLDNPGDIPSGLEQDIVRLVALMKSKGREDLLVRVFRAYVKLFRESEGIVPAKLTTVVPSADLEERLREIFDRQAGKRLELKTQTDPDLIGGFVLEVENYVLDASVRHQLELVRRQFTDKNRRIV